MPEVQVEADRMIEAPADRVFTYIRDYKQHHPKFLPPVFSDFRVEEGGVGEGTVVSFRMKAGRRERAYRMRVTEPEAGRVLSEADSNSSLVTTFTVTPEGKRCRVQIETRWQGASGMAGFMERLFAPPAMRKLYADELNQLDAYARLHSAETS